MNMILSQLCWKVTVLLIILTNLKFCSIFGLISNRVAVETRHVLDLSRSVHSDKDQTGFEVLSEASRR